jgi:coniferyl-aldehyde dehydrogenase
MDAAIHAAESTDPLIALLTAQRRAFAREPMPDWRARHAHLVTLERALTWHAPALSAAVDADFGGRSRHETELLELFPGLLALRHAQRCVRGWMRPQRKAVSHWFLPGSAHIVWQPLGVVGIVVPWNYPIYLTIGPLVSALAAGNRVLIKMPERTPRTAEAIAEMLHTRFGSDHVAVVRGDVAVARRFASLPFDHLLFTGSTEVGKHVMHAAADNLTPVTLELGGKSPAIIAPGFPLSRAVQRILIGKCLNAGQTCVAPDYVLLPRGSEAQFVAAARALVARWYPNLYGNADYTAIIDAGHHRRLLDTLDDARRSGADVIELCPSGTDSAEQGYKIAPTLVLRVTDTMRIMREEIFGPLLPLVPYDTLEQAIGYVNARPRPLALYYFDDDRTRIAHMLAHTHAGGVTVNDTILHIAQDELPFGGIGASGMGHYHGQAGFATFSKPKGVFTQSRLNAMPLLAPPYRRVFDALLHRMLR